ncbi:MAG: nucleotidyltransferase domain-containing protein [Candidatus Asgardarchaeia archaeon]
MKTYSALHEKYIDSLITRIKEHYKGNLVSLVIFGSYARNENKPKSDIDILIVLKNAGRMRERLEDFIENIEEPLEEIAMKLMDEGINPEISPIILTKEEARYLNPIYLDMTTSCIILYDKDNFMEKILENLREKMKNWKSYKENFGNKWIWVIKKGEFLGGVKLG